MRIQFQVRLLDSADEQILDQVESLFLEMYAYMSQKGLQLPLVDGGEKKWRLGLQRTLGHLGALVIAEIDDKVIGFMRGVIRLSPDHLGGQKIGYVDHTFIRAGMRGQGVGRAMFELLQDWFSSKRVLRLELQVLCGNEPGIDAWKAMGFQSELLQMQKGID
jgi:GNAT superfamily N-acetyltransferase